MEKDINSCLMMAMILETPISLAYCFASEDLKYVEIEPHVTLLYAQGYEVSKSEITPLKTYIWDLMSTSDREYVLTQLKDQDYLPEDWFGTIFTLDKFSNDNADYLILKLNEDDPVGEILGRIFRIIHKSIKARWEVKTTFDYTPHLTLAALLPGTAEKYINDISLHHVLEDSHIALSDFILSIGPSSEDGTPDRLQWNLTSFNAVDRYFQILEAKKSVERMKEDEDYIIEKEFSAVVETFQEEIKTSQVNGEKPKTVGKFKRKRIFK